MRVLLYLNIALSLLSASSSMSHDIALARRHFLDDDSSDDSSEATEPPLVTPAPVTPSPVMNPGAPTTPSSLTPAPTLISTPTTEPTTEPTIEPTASDDMGGEAEEFMVDGEGEREANENGNADGDDQTGANDGNVGSAMPIILALLALALCGIALGAVLWTRARQKRRVEYKQATGTLAIANRMDGKSTNMIMASNGSAVDGEGELEESEDGGSAAGNGNPQVVLDVGTPRHKSQKASHKSQKVKQAAMRYEAAMRKAADDREVMGSITLGAVGGDEIKGDTSKGMEHVEHDDVDDIENEDAKELPAEAEAEAEDEDAELIAAVATMENGLGVQLQKSEVGAKERAAEAKAKAEDEDVDAELMEAVMTMGAPDVGDEDEDEDDGQRLLMHIASDESDDEYKTPASPNMQLYKVSTTHASIEDMFDHFDVRATDTTGTRKSHSKGMEPGSPRMHYKASSTHDLEDMFDVQQQVVTATKTASNKANESTAQGHV